MLNAHWTRFFFKKKNQKSSKKRYENPRHIYFDNEEREKKK